jgi:hypothetical protein
MDIAIGIIERVIYNLQDPKLLRGFVDNRFVLIALVILLMRVKYATYKSMWLSALINIPGTFLHELVHYLIGSILNAKPSNFTIIPKKGNDGSYVMGSVTFSNLTFYNAIPTALAPLLLLPIGFYLNRHFLPTMTPSFLNYVLYILLQTIIIENSIPSRTDFRIAFRYFYGILLYGGLVVALLLF